MDDVKWADEDGARLLATCNPDTIGEDRPEVVAVLSVWGEGTGGVYVTAREARRLAAWLTCVTDRAYVSRVAAEMRGEAPHEC